jgi:L-serine dehydratase
MNMPCKSLKAFCEKAKQENCFFWQAVRNDDCEENGYSQYEAEQKMAALWKTMIATVDDYNPSEFSASGLSGTDGARFERYANAGRSVCGHLLSRMIATALNTAESNACMKRIVAAPTAGSCGVLPSVLIPLYRNGMADSESCLHALFTAAGIGKIIALNASISGAEGGCQAEIGAASAMAAGALVELRNGSAEQIVTAAGFALQNLLGLVCDPVAGLVEVPCVKRNVIGCANAVTAADMALAGIRARIPADEVISAMAAVGKSMSSDLRETGKGGLAATATARSLCQK